VNHSGYLFTQSLWSNVYYSHEMHYQTLV